MLKISELRERLKAEDWKTRYYAAFNLGRMIDISHIGELATSALEDDNEYVREGAVRSLIKIGGSTAAKTLEKALSDEYVGVRQWAAAGLGKIGNADAADALASALKDDDLKVREHAIDALGKIGDHRALEPLLVAQSVQRMSKGRLWKRIEIALGKIRIRGRKSQIKAIKESINNTPGSTDVDKIDKIETLAGTLYNWLGNVRPRIVKKLGETGNARAVKPLAYALKYGGKRARATAVKALAEIDCPEAVELLVFAMKDSCTTVCQKAIDKLIHLGDRAVEPVIADLKTAGWRQRRFIAHILVNIGELAVDALCRVLTEIDSTIRVEAAKILGMLGGEQAKECLVKVLADEADDSVRAEIAVVAGKLRDERALEPLITALTLPVPRFRIDAANALGILKNNRAVEPLLERLEDEDAEVRKYAAHALARIGDKRAVEPIYEKFKNEKNWVYTGTIAREYVLALAEIGDARAVATLASMRTVDASMAYRTLEKLGTTIPLTDNDYFCEKCNCRAKQFSSGVARFEVLNRRLFSSYYACRRCESNSYLLPHIKRVVLALDKGNQQAVEEAGENPLPEKKGDALIFYWHGNVPLADYNEIWIKDSDDYEVEKMVMTLNGDMDRKRRKRMSEILVTIWPEVSLSAAKTNLLKEYFKVAKRKGV